MKKILLIATALFWIISTHAETLVDFSKNIGTINIFGSTSVDAVKIHSNKDAVSGIKFANSYASGDALTGNYASFKCEGGFKAGDVITIAGAYNNSAEKNSAIDIYLINGDSYTVLFNTGQFINGRLTDDDPAEETFTLTEDYDSLCFGRNGNTGTFVTTLKVVRGSETPDDPKPQSDALVDYENSIGEFTAYGTCSVNDAVKIYENSKSVSGIKFSNSYKTDNALNGNYVGVECDGGFLAGDTVIIAGAYNNADEKNAAIHVFKLIGDDEIVLLFETQPFINGRTSADDPVKETFVLSEDADALCLGRQGNTGTFVTTFIVRRGTTPDTIPGDVNNDKTVDINDVVAVINHIAGTTSYEHANVNGDTDSDGNPIVDINDVVAIINIMAGQ